MIVWGARQARYGLRAFPAGTRAAGPEKERHQVVLSGDQAAMGFPGIAPEELARMTPYQREILLWAYQTRQRGLKRHLLIQAYAGAGKTTSLKHLAQMLGTMGSELRILAIVFNRHNAVTLRERLPAGVDVSTTHALGRRAIVRFLGPAKRWDHYDGKYQELCKAHVARRVALAKVDGNDAVAQQLWAMDPSEQADFTRGLAKLVNMAMLTRTVRMRGRVAQLDDEELYSMALLYDCDPEVAEMGSDMVAPIVTEGVQMVLGQGKGDFVDQLFIPASLPDVGRCVPRYDWVLGDEDQDWNRCQQELARLAAGRLGCFIGVGDSFQAIMGFAGADTAGTVRLKEIFSADELPLPTCWRCPASHIREAQDIVPGIQARPGAPEGTIVRGLTVEQMLDQLRPDPAGGDLVLCRQTAPLLDVAWQVIQEGITVDLRGRAIGDSILALIRKVIGRGKTQTLPLDRFLEKLDEWEAKQIAKITAKNGPGMEGAIQTLADRVQTVRVLCGRVRAVYAQEWGETPAELHFPPEPTTDHLREEIERMFEDKTGPRVTFSTVHRAKGDERARVWIIAPNLLGPGRRDKTPEAIAQARNVQYVAMTRSLDWLGYVDYQP